MYVSLRLLIFVEHRQLFVELSPELPPLVF